VLDEIVRLLHPFLPYVPEEIAAQYGAAPLLAQRHPGRDETLLAPDDEEALGRVQAAVNALRAFRSEAGVAPAQVLRARFEADAPHAAGWYEPFAPAFRALARVEFDAAGGDDDAVVLVPGGRLAVTAVIDRAEEAARLESQLARLEAEVRRSEAKLGNASFVEKAPAAIVEKERAKLDAHRREHDEVAGRLATLREA
jgi:valyl-tRNA synthetase